MSDISRAIVGAGIFDGEFLHHNHALALHKAGFVSVLPQEQLPTGCQLETLEGGYICPGFVDLQVNGGGGVMFNDDQSPEALRIIAQAHATTGTCAILPTLITDTPARTQAAINAVEVAIAQKVDGIIGIHLEGPHMSITRKGAHDSALIRPMTDTDLKVLLNAAERIANVMVTVAPENVTNIQIRSMADAGIIVSLGHTDAPAQVCHSAFDAGARCVTHLFNAMSQLGSREPGLVGATLDRGDIYAGLIADSIHVHPATIRVALAAKPQSERVFLVTDAMATTGSDMTRFLLNKREIFRRDNRLTLANGTLAGADLAMPRALSVMVNDVGESIETALRRATSTPAALLRDPMGVGRLQQGFKTAIHFERDLRSVRVLKAG